MSRYIDADKIVITAERGVSDAGLIFIPMIDAHRCIDATPTTDVVEVVRCKECKHCLTDDYTMYCERATGLDQILPDDYCSYGERREE